MPLYHRPKPLPLRPAHGVMPNFYYQKPVPFNAQSAGFRREHRRLVPTPAKPAKSAFFASLLAGVAFGMLVATGFALTLLVASLVWTSPHRSLFIGGLVLAYLTCALVTTRALGRRLRAWRPWEELQLRLRQDGRTLGDLLESAHQGRMPGTRDC